MGLACLPGDGDYTGERGAVAASATYRAADTNIRRAVTRVAHA